MKKKLLLLFIANFILINTSYSQIKVNVYNTVTSNGYNVIMDNDEFCPISVRLHLDLTNLSSTDGNDKVYVIPAKTKNFAVTTLNTIKAGAKYGYKTNFRANFGDNNLKNVDDYNYSLPFGKGKTFNLFQGYNGSFSHQNENSIDFTMPVGTEVVAARDGIVIKVVKNNIKNCAQKICAEFNNYALIYHSDGTFSKYVHFKFNGVSVKEGDTIKENDLIGYSGNVGWSSGPHLHFMTYIQRLDKTETLKTKFKINDGKVSRYLNEKEDCFKNY